MNASIIRRAARLEVLEREDGRNITKEEKRKNPPSHLYYAA